MDRRAFSYVMGAALIGALPGGCSVPRRAARYRYRYTIVVDDNGLERVGSSVVEVTERLGELRTGNTRTASIKGQAVVVDMGEGRFLFGTLDRPTGRLLKFYGLPTPGPKDKDGSKGIGRLSTQRGVMPVAPRDLVALATFRDNLDPRTARELRPDNLAAAFGPGVRLKRVTIEVTSDPISTGITRILPWLLNDNNYIDGGMSTATSVGFHTDQFVRGVK